MNWLPPRLQLFIRKHALFRFFTEKRRAQKQHQKKGTSMQYVFSRSYIFDRLRAFFNTIFSLRLLIVLVPALFILIFSGWWYLRQQISVKPFVPGLEASIPLVGHNEYTVGIFLYETEQETTGPVYRFIRLAAVYSYRNDGSYLLVIHPSFEIQDTQGNQSSIRTALNQLPYGQRDPFIVANEGIEDVIGLSIERYIAMELDSFLTFAYDNGFSPEIMNLESFNTVFETDDIFEDSVLDLQEDFLVQYLTGEFSWFEKFGYLTQHNHINSLVFSNMSRSEFFTAIDGLSRGIDVSAHMSRRMRREVLPELSMTPNTPLVDEQVVRIFSDFDILSEQAEIEVYNASGIPGVASQLTRQYRNLGANVVKPGNYFELINENIIFVENEALLAQYDDTIRMIERSLAGDVHIEIGTYEYNRIGDVIVVVGKER